MSELLFREDPYVRSCDAVVTAIEGDWIVLDRTVFYPTGGGQPGDRGELRLPDGGILRIVDTVKGDGGMVLHIAAPDSPLPAIGSKVTAEIDWPRRHRLMRMHSCLHLLSALVEGRVTGGQVGEDKSRLDFDMPDGAPDKETLTDGLARLVAGDRQVVSRWITDEELAAQPALVKTMSVAPPIGQGRVRLIEIEGVDLQACGGTHVARTGEIGAVRVSKIESKGRQNRRITITFAD